MSNRAVRLTPGEFKSFAEPSLLKIFRNFDVQNRPFRPGVQERLIIDTGLDFDMDYRQFGAVCRAAESLGDDHLLYSIVRASRGGVEHHTWRLPLFNYEEYADLYVRPSTSSYDEGFVHDRVVFSPQGKWVVLCPELFVLVGGSRAFIGRFKQEYPEYREDLLTFLDGFKEAARKRGVDVTWIQPLLDHVYGREAPKFEP